MSARLRGWIILGLFAGMLGCSSGSSTTSLDGGSDARRKADSTADSVARHEGGSDATRRHEAGGADAATHDASTTDAPPADAPPWDATSDAPVRDSSTGDGTISDGGPDGAAPDSGPDGSGSSDGGAPDAADAAGDAGAGDATDVDAGPPTATTLTISPFALTPAFSTSITDYYVRCASGTNNLSVSMTAAPGSTIAMVQPTPTSPSVEATTTIAVDENQAIVVAVTSGGETQDYWVRCLPHNFPRLQMTPHPEAGTPTPGYYLVGNFVVAPGGTGFAMVLDGNGVPVWYHRTSTGGGGVDVDSLLPGVISYVPDLEPTFSTFSGHFELHDLDAGTVSYEAPSGAPLDEHELQVAPNGDFLMIANPIVSGVNLTGLGTFGADANVIDCEIQELDSAGGIVWEWDAMDHLDPVKDSVWPGTTNIGGKPVVDAIHCNSIDVDPDGDILVSARQLNSIFLISKATKQILWKMGGKSYNKDGAAFISVTGDPMVAFRGQHDARMHANGEISMFDDQTGAAGPARAVLYALTLDAGADAGTAQWLWQFRGTATSEAMGSFRILDDGSRVIGWGMNGNPTRAFTEVDEAGDDLLDFVFPDGTESYRALKFPTSAFDLDVMRAMAGNH